MKTLGLFTCAMLLFCRGYGQQLNQLYDLPKIQQDNLSLPTPEPAQLIRYVDYPVSYSTGIPEISVPLYTVKLRELSLPLSLSYHAGGIKVEDVSGNTGLGWSLVAGGVISRVVNNQPDDTRSFDLRDQISIINRQEHTYLKQVLRHEKEAGYDRYYYNFPGGSGSFIYDVNTKQITEIPVTDNKIEVLSVPSAVYSKFNFKITTPDGTAYYFTETEGIGKRNPVATSMTNLYVNTDYRTTSSWYLTKIETFNKTETIEFVYRNVGQWSRSLPVNTISGSASAALGDVPVGDYSPDILGWSSVEYFDCKVLSEIRYKGGKVVFTHMQDRTDNGLKARLSRMDVYAGSVLRQYAVFQNQNSYFGDGRLRLAGVTVYGSDGSVADRYGFKYIDESVTISSRFAQDFFGYYTASKTQNLTFLNTGSVRIPGKYDYSFSDAERYSLKRITNATGGYTEFVYEANQHDEPVIGPVSIGVRIKEIGQYESDGTLLRKRSFNYYDSFTSIDFTKVNASCFLTQSGIKSVGTIFERVMVSQSNSYSSGSVLPGLSLENARVYYGRVSELTTGAGSGDTIRTDYEYNPRYGRNHFVYAGWPHVPSYPFEGSEDRRYLGSGFGCSLASQCAPYKLQFIPGYFLESNWAYDKLIRRTMYKKENGIFKPVEIETHEYEKFDLKELQVGLYVQGIVYTIQDRTNGQYSEDFKSVNDFFYFDVNLYNGYCKLKSTTKKQIFGSDTLRERWDYAYYTVSPQKNPGTPIAETDPFANYTPLVPENPGIDRPIDTLHPVTPERPKDPTDPGDPGTSLLMSVRSAGSIDRPLIPDTIQLADIGNSTLLQSESYSCNGKTYKREYTYATDFYLIGAHNLSALKEEKFSIDGVKKAAVNYNYTQVTCGGKTITVPSTVYRQVEDVETDRKTVTAYDVNGCPASMTRTGEPVTCYLWSYNGLYPVAEIKNASYPAVVSAMGGASVVNAMAVAAEPTASDQNRLEGLRAALPGALVTLYTYLPFTGLTSVTDPSGRKQMYGYDSCGRLLSVKDEDGNIVEQYEYHLKE